MPDWQQNATGGSIAAPENAFGFRIVLYYHAN